MGQADFLRVLSVGVIGACAADVYESRQVREEAAISGPLWVTQGYPIALTGRTGRKSVFSIYCNIFCSRMAGWPPRYDGRLSYSVSRGFVEIRSIWKQGVGSWPVMKQPRREFFDGLTVSLP